MLIIVGLGNPGEKFDNTRHNAGFEALDFFAKKNEFPDFEFSKKYNALVTENEDAMLAKPQIFMNESGTTISNFKLQISNLVVVHDDIDMPLGKIKFSKGNSSGGHKGIESIIQMLGTKDFIRLKIGIATGEEKAEDVVLKKFNPQEQETLNQVLSKTSEALEYFVQEGLEKTMNKYNK